MKNDFLYTNTGISIVDGSDDYGIKRFLLCDYGKEIVHEIFQQIENLQNFLGLWIGELEKYPQQILLLGYFDNKELGIVVSGNVRFSLDKRGQLQRQNFLVEGIVIAQENWEKNQVTWQVAFERETKNAHKLGIRNKEKVLLCAVSDFSIEEKLQNINTLFTYKEQHKKNISTLKLLISLTFLPLLLVVIFFYFSSLPDNELNTNKNYHENENKNENEKAIEQQEILQKEHWLQLLDEVLKENIELSKPIIKVIQETRRKNNQSSINFLYVEDKMNMTFIPEKIRNSLQELQQQLIRCSWENWKSYLKKEEFIKKILTSFQFLKYKNAFTIIRQELIAEDKLILKQYARQFESQLLLMIKIQRLVNTEKYELLYQQLDSK